MDENLQDIEDLFRDSLENNEETPPPQVWNNIDNILDKENVIIIRKKYSSLKKITLILLFLLSGLIIYELGGRLNNRDFAKGNTIRERKEAPIDNAGDGQNASSTNVQLQQGVNTPIKNKTFSRRPISAYTSSSKTTTPGITNTSFFRVKTNSDKPIEDNIQMVADNVSIEDNQQSHLLEWLHHRSFEKINFQTPDFMHNRKSTELNNINVTIKNTAASDTKKKTKKQLHFSVTPFFSPDAAWYHLYEDKPDNQPDSLAKIKGDERHEFSSTFGVLADYKVGTHWSFQTGLTYSNTNITVNPKTIYAQSDNKGHVQYRINTSSGYCYVLPSFSNTPAIGDSLNAVASAHSLLYIGIPIAVKYKIVKGRFSFNAITGLSANFLLQGKIETTVIKGANNEPEVVNNIQGLKKIYFSGLTGLGVEYNLGKRLALSFDPTLRVALNSINHNAPVKSYPNSFGFATGLKIEL